MLKSVDIMLYVHILCLYRLQAQLCTLVILNLLCSGALGFAPWKEHLVWKKSWCGEGVVILVLYAVYQYYHCYDNNSYCHHHDHCHLDDRNFSWKQFKSDLKTWLFVQAYSYEAPLRTLFKQRFINGRFNDLIWLTAAAATTTKTWTS